MSVSKDKLSASITVDLTVGVDSFKIVKDDVWLSLFGEDGNYRVKRDWPKASNVNRDDAPNFVIDVDKAGEYTFKWTFSNDSLHVDFPALEAFDVTISAADHVSISVKDGETPIGEKVEERTELTVLASADEGYRVVNLRAFKTGEPETTVDIIDGKLTMPDFAITIAADAADQLADGYYLVGTFTSWLPEAQYLFEENLLAEVEEYTVEVTLEEGDGIKVAKLINDVIDTWYPSGYNTEYKVDAVHAGDKKIYFRPASNIDWAEFGGFFYIEPNTPTAVDNTETTVKAVKTLENGMLIIEKNGVRYTVLGQAIK